MKKIWVVILFIVLSCRTGFSQEIIKAKDAHNYIGKKITVIGKIKYIAGPGYLSSVEYSLVTDSSELDVGVIVPIEIWEKPILNKLNQKGKIMQVTGLVKSGGSPYIEVKAVSDIKILN